ncbi:MAG: GFA family protein [Sphingomonas sp.]|uniref:GFA family protein n=1 Tax=Sphingomonas sp. TaxID=28214 RepID=UPI001AC63176|nr:GFA family protein [Sphingomonas sp.]MBN8808641.1 GFA family protein [Sphingomonas sp.]
MPIEGGCSCGGVRYALASPPMVVHCCHCTWCQRETGSAFVVNAVIEADRLRVTRGAADYVPTPSASGKGQEIARCPTCRVALWSHYAGSGRKSAFVRVGTMDDPAACPPDVHIFTASKQPWVVLSDGAPAFADFYPTSQGVWSDEGRARWKALMQG